MKKLILFVTVIFFAGTSCQKEYDIEADKQALIKLTAEDFDANFLSGNPDASVEFYTAQALRIQDGKKYSGKDAIRTKLTSIRSGYTILKQEKTVEDKQHVIGHVFFADPGRAAKIDKQGHDIAFLTADAPLSPFAVDV